MTTPGRPRLPAALRGSKRSVYLDAAVLRALERYRSAHPANLSETITGLLALSPLGALIEEERRYGTDARGGAAPDRVVEARPDLGS